MLNAPSNPRTFPKDVGILAMEIYFPRTCVDQTELGKYNFPIYITVYFNNLIFRKI